MDGVNWTMQYHGASSGTILADERLVGLAPWSGSELCTDVETMYSLSYLYQALGTNYYADRAELAAFNSLPVALTPDWWAHQYMSEPNQPYAQNLSETPFWNTNTWGQTFGLEPNYPCCTVNHPQGWPKFLSASFVRVVDKGLAHALLSPGTVNTTIGGHPVTISSTTAYPFLDTIQYTINSSTPFDFHIRVPSWAGAKSSIQMNSDQPSPLSPDPETGMHKISLNKGNTQITYTLDSTATRPVSRENDTVAIYKGALLYALEISSSNTSTSPKDPSGNSPYPGPDSAPTQSRDYEYHNESAWNYAIDTSTLEYHGPDAVGADYELANPIFASGAPPGYISVMGCQIDWPLYKGSVPDFAPTGGRRKCLGNATMLKLVPYGSAKTHMAELPTISLTG